MPSSRPSAPRASGEAGFSLPELLVAMVITTSISGAIFGLMTSGQGQFRREPALVDRQDNIRIAMDMIAQDESPVGFDPFPRRVSRVVEPIILRIILCELFG